MRYNVAGLLKSNTGAARTVEVDEPFKLGEPDLALVAPVRGVLRLIRDPGGILVDGRLTTVARMPCAR